MAIGWNNAHYYTDSGASRNSSALAHSAPSLSNGLLLVWVHGRASSARTINSVKRGTTDLTKIAGASLRNEYASGQYHYIEAWYEVAPLSGAQTINTIYSGAMSSDVVVALYLSGVEQSSSIGAASTNTGNDTTPTAGLTTVAANSWVLGGATQRRASGGSFTPGAGDTLMGEGQTGTGTQTDILWASLYTPTTVTGLYTVSAVNGTSSAQWTMGVVEIRAAAAGGGPVMPVFFEHYKKLMNG